MTPDCNVSVCFSGLVALVYDLCFEKRRGSFKTIEKLGPVAESTILRRRSSSSLNGKENEAGHLTGNSCVSVKDGKIVAESRGDFIKSSPESPQESGYGRMVKMEWSYTNEEEDTCYSSEELNDLDDSPSRTVSFVSTAH